MIFTFKKCWRNLKRTVSVVLCLVLLSVLFVVPASAVDITGGVSVVNAYRVNGAYSYNTVSFPFPVDGNFDSVVLLNLSSNTTDTVSFNLNTLNYSIYQPLSGTVGVYSSFYYQLPFASTITGPNLTNASPEVIFSTSDGASFNVVPVLDLANFAPPQSGNYTNSPGVVLKLHLSGLDSMIDVERMLVRFPDSKGLFYGFTKPASSNGSLHMVMPSIAVVVSESAESLESLEGIADAITEQSETLNAMYGDIMSLLNDLYTVLGDIKAVEELTNTYFATLIPIVNSLNTNTANIYALLQTQFQLLRTLIATESDDIQGAIDQQTQDLIDYFDTVFSGAVGDMPEKSGDLDTSVGNFSDAESQYQSTATQRFDELASSFNGFSGGTLSGITLASTLFTRVWDALGDYSIVYTFPLLLGLSLVLVGRLGRGSGGQSSAEKHRGDSSA